MATHSSILAWEIPRTEEPEGTTVQSMGLQKSRTQVSDYNKANTEKRTKNQWIIGPKPKEHLVGEIIRYLKQSVILIFQFSSVAHSCLTLCNPMNRSTPGLSVHHQLPEFTQTNVHRVSDAIQPSQVLCRPLFLVPPIPPSIRVFSNESTLCMRWPKYQFQL